MKIELDVDIEKFRISLVGNGYLKEEVENMSYEELILIFKQRVKRKINKEYHESLDICY